MHKLFYALFFLLLLGCGKDTVTLAPPSDVSGLEAEPRVGGVLLRWNLPSDSNFLYLEVRHQKKGAVVTTRVSRYTDSVLIEGLLNKLEYTFEVQSFNATQKGVAPGTVLTTTAVRPIRRPVKVVYYTDQLTRIDGITPAMLETFTQEPTEGPKQNLIDGNKSTYWHSAWSAGVAPLPHWIKISLPAPATMGVIRYYFRQNTDAGGRPNRFALETSADGTVWERVWTSNAGLPVDPVGEEKTLVLDKNYTARFFRVMILANPGNKTYTHLGDIAFFSMKEEPTDLEVVAEANY